jgi:hypothetical protein
LSPEHREYAELLLQKSRSELGAAQTLIATEDWAPHVVGFLLQQTVEKALKAILAAREIVSLDIDAGLAAATAAIGLAEETLDED